MMKCHIWYLCFQWVYKGLPYMVTMFLFQYVYDEVPYMVFMFSVGL